ncbi:hypothetical protein V6N13_134405 [Hibiscus sabdariffa]
MVSDPITRNSSFHTRNPEPDSALSPQKARSQAIGSTSSSSESPLTLSRHSQILGGDPYSFPFLKFYVLRKSSFTILSHLRERFTLRLVTSGRKQQHLFCWVTRCFFFSDHWCQNNLCKNCKRPGHFARECPNVAICHNCNLPGHIASECTTKSLCWNCREPGHTASNCPNEGICHTCGKSGHRARECTAPPMPPGDVRLCNNCYKPGHIAADCTNDKACNNCRRPGHLARECTNDPICNLCNVAGHMARHCPRGNMIGDRGGVGGGGRGGGYRDHHRDIVCRNCHHPGHVSRDCMGPLMICHNCGGRGHMAYECPSGRYLDRYPRRY